MTAASFHDAANDTAIAPTSRTLPNVCALRTAMAPLATGRRDFDGCCRSTATSSESFHAYVPDAAAQNATNATSVLASDVPSLSTPAAPGAAQTSTFLLH